MTAATSGTPSIAFPNTANYGLDCVISEVKVSLHLTTASGFLTTTNSPTAMVLLCGSLSGGGGGCTQTTMFQFSANATGNQLGSSCSDFSFDTTSSTPFNPLAPGAPPYSGNYSLDPGDSSVGADWHLKNAEFGFSNYSGGPADLTLRCATVDITTKIVPLASARRGLEPTE
jgi:hypothetical protein